MWRGNIGILPAILLLLPAIANAGNGENMTVTFGSMDECIDYAVSNSIAIEKSQVLEDMAELRMRSYKAGMFPALYASLSEDMTWDREKGISSGKYGKNPYAATAASVQLDWTAFDGGYSYFSYKAASTDRKMASLSKEDITLRTKISAAEAYMSLVTAMHILKAAQESFRHTESQVRKNEELAASGKIPRSEIPEIKAQAAREKARETEAWTSLRKAVTSLKGILNIPPETEMSITDTLPASLPPQAPDPWLKERLEEALENSPEMSTALLEYEKGRIVTKQAKGRKFPTISLSAGYGTRVTGPSNGRFMTRLMENSAPFISVSVTVPLANTPEGRQAVRIQELEEKVRKMEVAETAMRLRNYGESIYLNAVSMYEECISAWKSLEAAEESLKYTTERFDIGLSDASELSAAKSNRADAISDFLTARNKYMLQIKIIEIYCGK